MGSAAGLARVRDLVRAWAMVRGNETADRPWEDYNVAIKDMLAEEAEFTVYWPLRTNGENPPAPVQILPVPPVEEAGTPPAAEGEAAPAESGEAAPTA